MQQRQARARRLPKRERLEARVTREQKRLIERAAALCGTSVTEFVVASAHEAASNAIRDAEVLHLRDEARETFLGAVLHPPVPNAAARAAVRWYRRNVGR